MSRYKRRIVDLALAALLCGTAGACGTPTGTAGSSHRVPSPSLYRPSAPASLAGLRPQITFPVRGTGTFVIAPDGRPVVGSHGTLLRYRIAVERGIKGISASTFAMAVFTTLSDPRSWIGTGQWRLQQVPATARYDFTIYLATPATRDVLCKGGYDRYTSCRRGNSVVLNVARWVHGVPHYGASLKAYREYMINHEVGHRLYNGHELCPGPGSLAPVMQQQSLGLHGCLPNSWPVVNGNAYHGRSGQYDDPLPRA